MTQGFIQTVNYKSAFEADKGISCLEDAAKLIENAYKDLATYETEYPIKESDEVCNMAMNLVSTAQLAAARSKCHSFQDIEKKLLFLRKEIEVFVAGDDHPQGRLYFAIIDSCLDGLADLQNEANKIEV